MTASVGIIGLLLAVLLDVPEDVRIGSWRFLFAVLPLLSGGSPTGASYVLSSWRIWAR
jgi:hypothetical protein